MVVAVSCICALGVLLFGLGISTSAARGSANVLGGQPDDPADTLFKRIRAHGNTAEYAPMLAVLMLYLGLNGAAGWVCWVMIIVTVCRYLLVAGILLSKTLSETHPLRFVGALGTYVGGLVLVVAAVLTVI